MKSYKIWDPKKNLYSLGGVDAATSDFAWDAKGKFWPRIGALKAHLKQLKKVPAHWYVVEFEVSEPEPVGSYPIGRLK